MMKKASGCSLLKLVFSSLLFILFLLPFSASAQNKAAQDVGKRIDSLLSAEHVADEIIVKFRDGTASSASLAVHSLSGNALKKVFKGPHGLHLVKIRRDIRLEEALRAYLLNPLIEYAEPNYIVYMTGGTDDTYFGNLWGLHNEGQTGGTIDADIDAPEAWDLTTGSGSVIIAIVDTGVAVNHPDISGNIWSNPGEVNCSDGIDDEGNGYIDDCHGWDFIGDDNDPADLAGHGTHVAGTIAATGNNGLGTTGVMWQAQIMPLRFLGVSGSGTTDGAISAVLYANAKGAHIINNSWGGSGFSQALKDAIDASAALVVCAAGNEGMNSDTTPFYPAGYSSPNILSVAATDHNDALAYFSNYGAVSVDVAAPGVSIYSSIPNLNYGPPVTVYSQNFNGSSGSLPLLGWNKGGSNSTWAVTAGTVDGGTNSLEDSPKKNYRGNTSSWAGYMTPVASVKDNRYDLSFKWKGVLENNYDYLDINISFDGVNWDWVDYRTGSTGGAFLSYSTDAITYAADVAGSFYFGFGLSSDSTFNYDGAYIDDIVLTRKSVGIGSYGYVYYSGTSMAAPHVSGAAGLIKAYNAGLTSLEIKDVILNNVDPISSLTGKVLTGGRINAFNSLNSMSCPDQPARISRVVPAYYPSLQAAYNAAGDGETIQCLATDFTEDLEVNLNKSVVLKGGYNCGYTAGNGVTIINGSVTVADGIISMENFVLQ